jgi:GNAT superfamily N-acetyltransferase
VTYYLVSDRLEADCSEGGVKGVIEIVPLDDKHLEDAAALVTNRFRQLHKQAPLLPSRYTEASAILPYLSNISAKERGVAAIRERKLVGFLTGWRMPSFRGQRSTYSPEWANAAEPGSSQYIYEEMYSHLAADWVADKYVAHYISIFPNDGEAIRACHWMGFGMVAVDAIRNLDLPSIGNKDVEVRLAGNQDLDEVMALDEALWQHMQKTPTFLLLERKERSHYEEWINDPRKSIWLATVDEEPMAFMSVGPAKEDVCAFIVDKKTTSIYGAFTKEQVRGKGIASALLSHMLEHAGAAGYKRCAVDFEPMNLVATRFWLKQFRPVCFSLFRQIDDRLIDR